MKKLILIILILLGGYVGFDHYTSHQVGVEYPSYQPGSRDVAFENAFRDHAQNLQLEGSGTVIKLLPDDLKGRKHQRFIVRLDSGQTLMIAHNISLAPRIDALREGDTVIFSGEYQWNEKGGVLHWTHRDPGGSHVAGWIMHKDQKYQ